MSFAIVAGFLIVLSILLTGSNRQKGEKYIATELRLTEESAQAVTKGTRNPLAWLILIGSVATLTYTNGLSAIGFALAIYMMSGGAKNVAIAATPKVADVVAPIHGVARIISALGFVLIYIFLGIVILAALGYNGLIDLTPLLSH